MFTGFLYVSVSHVLSFACTQFTCTQIILNKKVKAELYPKSEKKNHCIYA